EDGVSPVRWLYEQKILLLPGLPGVDKFRGYAERRYGGLPQAFERLQSEAGNLVDDLQEPDTPTGVRAEADIIARHLMPTWCLMNTACGARYASTVEGHGPWQAAMLRPILTLAVPPDAYTFDEIGFDWNSVRDAWKQGAKAATETKTPPPRPKSRAERH